MRPFRRVALVHLPVPDPNFSGERANVPLATASLASSLMGRPGEGTWGGTVELLPGELSDRGSDAAVLKWLTEGDFDLVGFSLALWNRERALWLAGEWKKVRPGGFLVAGGPEVIRGRSHPARGPEKGLEIFDHLVAGEGEQAFYALVCGGTGSRLWAGETFCRTSHPYLNGVLEMGPDRPVHLETLRGCPFRCAYCSYGRNSTGLRELEAALVEEVVRKACSTGVRDLYLMDPTVAARRDFDRFLKDLAQWNTSGLKIHTEITGEAAAGRAGLLAAAGVASVEVGLQSINSRALKAVRRPWDRKKFEKGLAELGSAGIRPSLGVILGLPEDGPEEMEATVGYVADLGLGEEAGAFPLALLPGTDLRDRSADLELEFMPEPPYFVLETPWASQDDILEVLDLSREEWGREPLEPVRPRFVPGPGPYRDVLDLRKPEDQGRLNHPETLAWSLSLLVSWKVDPSSLEAPLARLAATCPHTQLQLIFILERGDSPPGPEDWGPWERALFGGTGPRSQVSDRLRRYLPDPQGRFSYRKFLVTPDLSLAQEWDRNHGATADLVLDLRRHGGREDQGEGREWETLPFLWTDEPLTGELEELYRDFEDLVILQSLPGRGKQP